MGFVSENNETSTSMRLRWTISFGTLFHLLVPSYMLFMDPDVCVALNFADTRISFQQQYNSSRLQLRLYLCLMWVEHSSLAPQVGIE